MRKPSVIELLNTLPIILVLILIGIFPAFFPSQLFIAIYILVLSRFFFPYSDFETKFTHIDFSKIINSVLWTVIVGLIYSIEIITRTFEPIAKNATIALVILFFFYQTMRGIHYYFNKEEPIFEARHFHVGLFFKTRNRVTNERDVSYSKMFYVLYLVVLVVIINLDYWL
jgi:hypothetical protein